MGAENTLSLTFDRDVYDAPFDALREPTDGGRHLILGIVNAPDPRTGRDRPGLRSIVFNTAFDEPRDPEYRSVEAIDRRTLRFRVLVPADFGGGPYYFLSTVFDTSLGGCDGGQGTALLTPAFPSDSKN